MYSITSFIFWGDKFKCLLFVFLTSHVSISIRVLILIWFVLIKFDYFISLSFIFMLLAVTCEYVFICILVFTSFSFFLDFGHPAHAALWAPPQFTHFHFTGTFTFSFWIIASWASLQFFTTFGKMAKFIVFETLNYFLFSMYIFSYIVYDSLKC